MRIEDFWFIYIFSMWVESSNVTSYPSDWVQFWTSTSATVRKAPATVWLTLNEHAFKDTSKDCLTFVDRASLKGEDSLSILNTIWDIDLIGWVIEREVSAF